MLQITKMEQQQDLLSDLENQLVKASPGKRFANFIIDRIIFYAFTFVLGIMLALIDVEFASSLGSINRFLDIIITSILFGIFMGLIEAVFKGRSLGKLITGTKAVNMDGTNISASTAFARGFSRAVPFEPFSALGNGCNPWHDRWNKTMVIDLKESNL